MIFWKINTGQSLKNPEGISEICSSNHLDGKKIYLKAKAKKDIFFLTTQEQYECVVLFENIK